ncbi:hypothetical protein GCM10023200_51860 [Actinomycetospora chlora]|jgi:hypothetical protein|uniref:Uncharacterized protein n=1 Tax=Actinomycetospora chlora TaxID=663608 RepID=A0ABP9CH01_9PSEU
MFRRSTSTARSAARRTEDEDALLAEAGRGLRGRHTRRARQQEAVDTAALQARLERVHRRLAEVGSVQVRTRTGAIDTEAARRDPLTRPFAPADGERVLRRRTDTAALPRPA